MIFHIRFFTKEQPKALVKREKFDILGVRGANEEPVTLYLVSTRKT